MGIQKILVLSLIVLAIVAVAYRVTAIRNIVFKSGE